jgi:hypothetical protein
MHSWYYCSNGDCSDFATQRRTRLSGLALSFVPGIEVPRLHLEHIQSSQRGCCRAKSVRIAMMFHLLIYASAASLLILSSAGCATQSGYDHDSDRRSHFHLYKPFDNSRDWGPGYLVGPPGQYFGRASGIDDRRSTLPDKSTQESQSNPLGLGRSQAEFP